MEFIIGLIIGILAGGLSVIIFGKNNKKHIEAVRSEVVGAYNKGAGELEQLMNSWKK